MISTMLYLEIQICESKILKFIVTLGLLMPVITAKERRDRFYLGKERQIYQ